MSGLYIPLSEGEAKAMQPALPIIGGCCVMEKMTIDQ
jgi:hypothetical protein